MKVGRAWLVVVLAGLALLVIVCAVQAVGSAARQYGNDFTSYLTASRAFWSGANPYLADTLFPFIYPLFLCVVIWPLTRVPLGVAAGVWYAVSAGAIAATMALVGSLAVPAQQYQYQRRRWIVAAGLVCFALTDVIQNNLVNGQVNALVLALCVWFGWLWARGGRVWPAVALGAAIALKLTPAVLLIFLLRRGAWRDVALTVAAAGVFAVGLPWFAAGSVVWADYQHYGQSFLTDRLIGAGAVVTHHRAFGLVEVLRQAIGSSWTADTWIAAAVVTAGLLMADRPRSPLARDAAAAVPLYLAASLLISPMSEVHHLIFLLPGLFILAWRVAARQSSPAAAAGLAMVLLALIALRHVPFAAFGGVLGTCALLGAGPNFLRKWGRA